MKVLLCFDLFFVLVNILLLVNSAHSFFTESENQDPGNDYRYNEVNDYDIPKYGNVNYPNIEIPMKNYFSFEFVKKPSIAKTSNVPYYSNINNAKFLQALWKYNTMIKEEIDEPANVYLNTLMEPEVKSVENLSEEHTRDYQSEDLVEQKKENPIESYEEENYMDYRTLIKEFRSLRKDVNDLKLRSKKKSYEHFDK